MNKRTKNRVIAIRVTPDTFNRIHEKADASGRSLEEYLTDAALRTEVINLNDLTSFLPELKRQGSNLNQLSILAHTGKIKCPDIGETQKLYSELLRLLRKIAERR